MIGKRLSPILEEIEDTLWEFEADVAQKPEFTMSGFRAASKIFFAAFMDKMWELQTEEKITQETREDMAVKAGEELRQLVKKYTNIDTVDLYDRRINP